LGRVDNRRNRVVTSTKRGVQDRRSIIVVGALTEKRKGAKLNGVLTEGGGGAWAKMGAVDPWGTKGGWWGERTK